MRTADASAEPGLQQRSIRRLGLALLALCAGACAERAVPSRVTPTGPGTSDLAPVGDQAPLVDLSAPDLLPPPPLDIMPTAATLLIGDALQFTSDRPASWSVVEPAHAGRIDADGAYLAPSVAGVVHVRAVAADGASAEATLTVQTGTLRLLAGRLGGSGNGDGVGADARFAAPGGLAFDGQHTLYVGDFPNYAIRAVDVDSGAVTTPAFLSQSFIKPSDGWGWYGGSAIPAQLAFDRSGRLIIAAWRESALLAADLTSQTVSVFSGSYGVVGATDGDAGSALFHYPSGLGYDGGDFFYVTDDDAIRSVDATSGAVLTLAGVVNSPGNVNASGPNARFDVPMSVTSDGNGHLYVADLSNNAVRRVTLADSSVDTVAASTPWGLPAGVLFFDGALYVAESSCISRVDLASDSDTVVFGDRNETGEWDGIGPNARLARPQAMVGDGHGGLYVGDGWGPTIRHLDFSDLSVTTLAGSAIPAPSLWGSSYPKPDPHLPIYTARGVAGDGAGNFYVADAWGGTIERVTPAGAVTTLVGNLYAPTEVAFDGDHTLYVADGTELGALDLSDDSYRVVAGAYATPGFVDGAADVARFGYLHHIVLVGSAVYGTDATNYRVRRIDVASGAVSTFAGSGTQGSVDAVGMAAQFEYPSGIASDGRALYVADTLDLPGLRRIELTSAAVTTVAVATNGSDGRFHFGAEYITLAADDRGRVYAAIPGGVIVIDVPTGSVEALAGIPDASGVLPGPLPARMNNPLGLALTPDGLAVTDEDALLLIHGR